jgi:glycosyltransferase involved in cell wall biosynthesis
MVQHMLKIVHLTSAHPPFDIRIFQKECRTLAEAGYNVVLIAPHQQNEAVHGVYVKAVAKSPSRLKRFTQTVWNIYRTAVKMDANVYHFHDPDLAVVGLLLRARGKLVVYDMHENVPKALLSKEWVHPAMRQAISKSFSFLENAVINRFAVIFAEASYEKDYPHVDKSVTVLNMPPIKHLLKIEEGKHALPTVGYLGGVEPLRGSSTTLKALCLLRSRGQDVAWECIGRVSTEHQRYLEDAALRCGLRVNIPGYLPPEQGWRAIARCHIGLALLKPIPNYVESYPTKIFEYMAFGLPVIASDFPLYREIVASARCGICVDPDSIEAIADATQWLLEHPDEAAAMGKRGQEAVRAKYNWDVEAQKLLDFYQDLTERGVYKAQLT